MRSLKFLLLLIVCWPAAFAQVVSNPSFATAMARARGLEAGAGASDVPHYIHYDLKLYSHNGKLTKGTWDVWREPVRFIRSDLVAGDFRYTRIDDLVHRTQWRHFSGLMPLKVYDLLENYSEPAFAGAFFSANATKHHVHFAQVQGAPFSCTDEVLQMRVCFDPLAHVLAFAEMFNQTVTWEDWQPVGTHTAPKQFRIYDAGSVMVEADGTVQVVKGFPPDLFRIPAGEPDMGEPENNGAVPHKIASAKAVDLDLLYGNLLIKLNVDAGGRVHKADLIDADDDDLIHTGVEFAKKLTFVPATAKGVAEPFEQYIYLRYALGRVE